MYLLTMLHYNELLLNSTYLVNNTLLGICHGNEYENDLMRYEIN